VKALTTCAARAPKAPSAAARSRPPLPVRGREGGDDIPRAAADRVAIVAQGADVDLPGQLGHLGAGHADAEVAPADAEPPLPRVVEDLGAPGEGAVDHDVLGPRDVPHEPGQRVEVLARARPHLVVGEAAEGPLGQRGPVAAHRGGVHGAVLLQEEIARVHRRLPVAYSRSRCSTSFQ
jgi:hypothetical protein